MSEKEDVSRRKFLQTAAIGAGSGVLALTGGAQANAKKAKPHKKVPRKKLGSTGKSIPILLMGAAQSFNSRYDKLLHRGFKDGINYIDTALTYERGNSHLTLAPFIKQIKDRSKLWITSKVPHHGGSAGAAEFKRDLDICLRDLDTPYLDMLFIHQVEHEKYLSREYLKMADAMKKSGKIKYYGFSCHSGNVVELMNKAAKTKGIDAIMFRYDFTRYGDSKLNRAIDACKKAGIGLIAMKTQRSVPDDLAAVVKFKLKKFTLGQAKLKAVWADERIDAAVSHMTNLQLLKERIIKSSAQTLSLFNS